MIHAIVLYTSNIFLTLDVLFLQKVKKLLISRRDVHMKDAQTASETSSRLKL